MSEESRKHTEPNIDPTLEARLVALVLGEASDFERAELEQLIAERPELEELQKEIREVHAALEKVGQGELPPADSEEWKLSEDKRETVIATLEGKAKPTLKDDEIEIEARQSRVRGFRLSPSSRRTLWRFAKGAAVVAGVSLLCLPFLVPRTQFAREAKSRAYMSRTRTLESQPDTSPSLRGIPRKFRNIEKDALAERLAGEFDSDLVAEQAKEKSSLTFSAESQSESTEYKYPRSIDDKVVDRQADRWHTQNPTRWDEQQVAEQESEEDSEAGEPSSSIVANGRGGVPGTFTFEDSGSGNGLPDLPSELNGDSNGSLAGNNQEGQSQQGGYGGGDFGSAGMGDDGYGGGMGGMGGGMMGGRGYGGGYDGGYGRNSGAAEGEAKAAEAGYPSITDQEQGLALPSKPAQIPEGMTGENYTVQVPAQQEQNNTVRVPVQQEQSYAVQVPVVEDGRTIMVPETRSRSGITMMREEQVTRPVPNRPEQPGDSIAALGDQISLPKSPSSFDATADEWALSGERPPPSSLGYLIHLNDSSKSMEHLNKSLASKQNAGPGMAAGQGRGDRPEEKTSSSFYDSKVRTNIGRGKMIIAGTDHDKKYPVGDLVQPVEPLMGGLPEAAAAKGLRLGKRVLDVDLISAAGGRFRAKPHSLFLPNAQPSTGLSEKIASKESFSTFSLHVSDVSFKLARAALAQGQWPDAAKVRIEEFVNAFDYGDPMPCNGERVACVVEQSIHPFLQQRNMLRVSMRTAAQGRSASTPLRLTLLLDNSGSMERIDRQQTLRKAFSLLAKQLKPIDQVTLISFARRPRLLADKVSGAKAQQLVNRIENLPSEGGTNVEAALQVAFEKAMEQRVENAQNRIILLTDGAVNLGNADPEGLSKMIATMRDRGIAFDAAGISAEGLNDEILEALTRKGDGRYYLLDSVESADAGFAKQIAGALRPSAKNVKVQVEFNPDRVGRYKLLGFEKHRLKKEDFRNDKVDAAEMAAAEAGVAVYQFEAKPNGTGNVGSVSVRFRDLATGQMVENRWPIPYEPSVVRIDQASDSLRVATTAAMLAAKLRSEPLGQSVELKSLADLVTGLPEQTRSSQRVQELEQMIQQARQIQP